MIALDTNIATRYLVNDEPEQAARARQLVDGSTAFVAKTVMLETEWVLRSVYKLPRAEVLSLLSTFAGLPTVIVEDAEDVANALAWCEQGVDFADALHLASGPDTVTFASFDKAFNDAAERLGLPVFRP